MVDIDQLEAEGLLEGIDHEEAGKERVALVNQLLEDGFSLEELRTAAHERRLALLPVERILDNRGARFSTLDIVERTGLPLELWSRMRRALGFAHPEPDDVVFDDADLEAAQSVVHFFLAGIPEDTLEEIARVIGHDMTKLAETLRLMVGEALLSPGDSEQTIGARYAHAAETLVPLLTPTLEYVLKVHLREQIKTAVLNQTELLSGRFDNARTVTAAFADLVGFTELSERVTPHELGAAGKALIELTLTTIGPPVRLVKSSGDGVLLVSPEPGPLVEAALALAEEADSRSSIPRLRVGIASGEAIPQAGDWFGRPVNLASRITASARPGSVLATKEVYEMVIDAYSWSFAGTQSFRGIKGAVPLYRARRLA